MKCRHCKREYEKQWRADFCNYDVCKALNCMERNPNACKYCKKEYPKQKMASMCRYDGCKLFKRKIDNPYIAKRHREEYVKVFKDPKNIEELKAIREKSVSEIARHFNVHRTSILYQLRKLSTAPKD